MKSLNYKVNYLLFKSNYTCYQMHKLTKIPYQSLYSFRNRHSNYNNMPFRNAKLLGRCYDTLVAHK